MNTRVLGHALRRAQAKRRLPAPAVRRLIRQRAGVTQAAIATTLGVTRESVTQWESGRRSPHPDVVRAYVAILDRLARESLT